MVKRSAVDIEKLIADNAGLVRSVAARRYPARRYDQDLLQCGMVGLWQAAKRWEGKGPFVAYARVCIAREMGRYVRGEAAFYAREMPTDEFAKDIPAADHAERTASRLDARAAIDRVGDGRKRYILAALAAGRGKREVAAELGMTTAQVTRAAKRAMGIVNNL